MPADSAIVNYEDLGREEYRQDAARDRRGEGLESSPLTAAAPEVIHGARTWHVVAAGSDRRVSAERDLLSGCRMAASLVAPDGVSHDDRADCAATLAARHVKDRTPAGLSQLCGEARNFYRALKSRQEREQLDALADAANRAATPAAMGADDESVAERIDLDRMAAADAADAATALARRLRFKLEGVPDAPVWTALYCWLRGRDIDVCAADRGVSADAMTKRRQRGAAMICAAYPAGELLRVLGMGTGAAEHRPGMTPSGALIGADWLVYGGDATQDAGHRTPALATDRYDQPEAEVSSWRTYPIDAADLRPRIAGRERPEVKREAFRWNRAEYRRRMIEVGRAADLAAEHDRAGARKVSYSAPDAEQDREAA